MMMIHYWLVLFDVFIDSWLTFILVVTTYYYWLLVCVSEKKRKRIIWNKVKMEANWQITWKCSNWDYDLCMDSIRLNHKWHSDYCKKWNNWFFKLFLGIFYSDYPLFRISFVPRRCDLNVKTKSISYCSHMRYFYR